MMLGFLLARAGVDVVVLEKHADFLRDFRGDTIHPSTLEVMHELGLLEQFLERPHQELSHLDGQVGDARLTIADFSHLPTKCKFIALMPQWDFLNFLAEHGRRYPAFHLRLEAEVTGLLQSDGRITGVEVKTPDGRLEVGADLVVGADGRGSTVRELAGLEIIDLGAPLDVLWMRISKTPGDPSQTLGRVDAGKILVMIDRGEYWQCAYVIPKGGIEEIRQKGLPAFRDAIAALAPQLRDRMGELKDWSEVKLLTVKVDRLRRWHRPGLLCIGDAAHAMSPIGGVGINLAIQDAVAAANILALPLRNGAVTSAHLQAVQRRRELPTRIIQGAQVFIQNRVIAGVLSSKQLRTSLPLPLRLLRRWRPLQRIPAYLVGVGVRPEHVRIPALRSTDASAEAGRLVRLSDGKARLIGAVPITIGRDPSSDFPLEGEDVSRSHAYLLRTPQGFLLVDSSLHGTHVNGVRVQSQRILADGDVVEIAGHSFRFDLYRPDAQPSAPVDAPHQLPETVEHPRPMPRAPLATGKAGLVLALAERPSWKVRGETWIRRYGLSELVGIGVAFGGSWLLGTSTGYSEGGYMPKILQQSLSLPAPPAALYDMYLDPDAHSAFTGGGAVWITAIPGTKWSAFDGRIHGIMLTLAPNRQIVQSWRSFEWEEGDLDSILILTFLPQADGTRLELIHANVPDRLYDTLLAGWPQRYWQPWETYLRSRK